MAAFLLYPLFALEAGSRLLAHTLRHLTRTRP